MIKRYILFLLFSLVVSTQLFGQAANPTFSLASGSYVGTQTVTLSDTTPSSVICWTATGYTTPPQTNGLGTGCIVGTQYSGAISVAHPEPIYAVAGSATLADSAVVMNGYQIQTATPVFSPATGVYSGAQSVTITAASSNFICYSTTVTPQFSNGSQQITGATWNSGTLTATITVPDSSAFRVGDILTIYFIGGSISGPGTYNLKYVPVTAVSTGSISYPAATNPGTYSSVSSNSAAVYGGSQPTSCGVNSTLYTGAISVPGNGLVYATSSQSGFADFSAAGAYTLTAPVFPTLPQSQATLTTPTITGSDCAATNQSTWIACVAAATCNSSITITAGITVSRPSGGSALTPTQNCGPSHGGWIQVRSSALSSMAGQGHRVAPTFAPISGCSESSFTVTCTLTGSVPVGNVTGNVVYVEGAGNGYSGTFTTTNMGLSTIQYTATVSGLSSTTGGMITFPPPYMARIDDGVGTGNVAVINWPNGAGGWVFSGIELAHDVLYTPTTEMQVGILLTDNQPTSTSQFVHDIMLDRVYIHGSPSSFVRRGVQLGGTNFTMRDSWCSEFHDAQSDSQCIGGTNFSGPVLIENNFLHAATEVIIWGGQQGTITGVIPSDITILGNVFDKNIGQFGVAMYTATASVGQPCTVITSVSQYCTGAWWVTSASGSPTVSRMTGNGVLTWAANTAFANVGDAFRDSNSNFEVLVVAGTTGGTQPTWPHTGANNTLTTDGTAVWAMQYNWSVKNLVENKVASREIIDGNLIQHTWVSAQVGNTWLIDNASYALYPNPSTNYAANDVIFTHNKMQDASQGIEIDATEYGFTEPMTRIFVQNNLEAISGHLWAPGPSGAGGENWGITWGGSYLGMPSNIVIDHNDFFNDYALGSILYSPGFQMPGTQFTNNLGSYSSYGIVASSTTACGGFTNGTVGGIYNQILFVDKTTQANFPPCSGGQQGTTLWGGTTGSIGFTNYVAPGTVDPATTGNFQLTSGSPYHNAGTDGKDVGVFDWTCLNLTTNAAIAGTYSPSTMGSCYNGGYGIPTATAGVSKGVTVTPGVSIH
jgi:hypothetical protein